MVLKKIVSTVGQVACIEATVLAAFFMLVASGGSCLAQKNTYQFDNYTTASGMVDHYTTCLHQDKAGWLWIGTGSCIERFDGIEFKHYGFVDDDASHVENFLVRDFFESKNGVLYVGVEEFGLLVYNKNKDVFERLRLGDNIVLADVSVKCLDEDFDGNIWAATKQGLQKIDLDKQIVLQYLHNSSNPNSISSNYVRKVVVDSRSVIWVGTQKGLDKFMPHAHAFSPMGTLKSALLDDILDLTIDKQQRLWVGTSHNGLQVINNDEITDFLPLKNYERTEKVTSVFQEEDSKLWIGTRGGLFLFDEEKASIEPITNDPLNRNSLLHNSVNDIIKDVKGDLWIATRGGLSYLVKEKQHFKNILAQLGNTSFLNNGEVYCIWQQDENHIWMGTEQGGVNILNRQTGQFTYLTKENSRLSSNCIKVIHGLGNGKVLIGTFGGGLNLYDSVSRNISLFNHEPNTPSSLSNNIVWDIANDQLGNIWIGTASGLDKFNVQTQTFTHMLGFDEMVNGVNWLAVDADNDIWCGSEKIKIFRPDVGIINEFDEKSRGFFRDRSGHYWIMTVDKGIALYDKEKGALCYYNKESGLSNNLTYCMLQDSVGDLWVSTANGLARFNQKNQSFANFYQVDGLQGDQFLYGASNQNTNGEMFFGGIHGVSFFSPDEIEPTKKASDIYFTDFKVFNKSVKSNNSPNAILKKAISVAAEVTIPYQLNVITFEYAALDFTNSHKLKYSYLLEGFDSEWSVTDARKITYTNLYPGEYVFRVKLANQALVNQKEASIRVVVVPPFYLQTWFVVMVSLAVIFIVVFLFYSLLKRRERQKASEFEKMKSKKMHELDAFKLRLFSNISHEIKTPLTLILSPLKKLIQGGLDNESVNENLHLMEKNTFRLMSLVSQLLDYRKLQDGKLEIEYKRGDIVRFCNSVLASFTNHIIEKGQASFFRSDVKEWMCQFDAEKIRTILNNLISNAIKYNTPNGNIFLHLSRKIEKDIVYVQIDVEDNGVGISLENQENVFDRYYTDLTHQDSFSSSGIGLSYTKELVDLYNGELLLKSEKGKGATFTVMIPVPAQSSDVVNCSGQGDLKSLEYISTKAYEEAQRNKKVLLIVEDNSDIRLFLKSSLKEHYLILESDNGSEGFEIALKALPDLIVSDVMMPGMSGYELCQKVKMDERTSHIPLIMLTALSSVEQVKRGLDAGADDFISKPFDMDILQVKIDNLFRLRQSLIAKFSQQVQLLPTVQSVKTPDEKFLDRTLKLIENRLDDPTLDIETFVTELGVSRMQLYRKIGALTGMAVKELVNDVRLTKAGQFLKEKQMNVSEVADLTGFSDLSYFGKCFKKKFGVSPSVYMKM